HIGEGPVVIVVEQHGARGRFLALHRWNGGPIQEVDVEPSVIVKIKEGYSGSRRFNNRAFVRSARLMVELVEASGVSDVGEHDRRSVDKPARCDGTGQRVLNRGVCDSGTHAVLLNDSIGSLRILCGSLNNKQHHKDCSDYDEPGNQLSIECKLLGNQCGHLDTDRDIEREESSGTSSDEQKCRESSRGAAPNGNV